MALKALGSEPAPTAVNDSRRVVLEGGGNDVAMSLYRALGRGTGNLAEPQIRERQEAMLRQFEAEAEAVLRLLSAFRTVVQMDDYRKPAIPAATIQHEAVNGGQVMAVRPGAMTVINEMQSYEFPGTVLPGPEVPVPAGGTFVLEHHVRMDQDGTVSQDQSRAPDWTPAMPPDAAVLRGEEASGGSGYRSGVVEYRRTAASRAAPDMETCDQCRGTVLFDPHDGSFTHEDGSPAWSKDGRIIHEDQLQTIIDNERLREMAETTPPLSREKLVAAFGSPWPETLVSEPSRTKAEQEFAEASRRLEEEGFGVHSDAARFVETVQKFQWSEGTDPAVQEGPADVDEAARRLLKRIRKERVEPELARSRSDSGIDAKRLDDNTDAFLALPPAATDGRFRRGWRAVGRWFAGD
jgi:hypothetical protein